MSNYKVLRHKLRNLNISTSVSITRNAGNYESVKGFAMASMDVQANQDVSTAFKDLREIVSEEAKNIIQQELKNIQVERLSTTSGRR